MRKTGLIHNKEVIDTPELVNELNIELLRKTQGCSTREQFSGVVYKGKK